MQYAVLKLPPQISEAHIVAAPCLLVWCLGSHANTPKPRDASHVGLPLSVRRSASGRQDEMWKIRAAKRAEAAARTLAEEAERLENALKNAAGGLPTTLPQLSPNGNRGKQTFGKLGSPSRDALETNAALQKLARETLALSSLGRA